MRAMSIAIAVFVGGLTGCATGTGGVVNIGPDMYMIGGQGGFADFSSSAVKARFFEQAQQYCSKSNREMLPLNSTGRDSGMGTYASAEVQFRCVPKSAPR